MLNYRNSVKNSFMVFKEMKFLTDPNNKSTELWNLALLNKY
jgi:hypothetical protein